jgi:hypothetical protein
LKHDGRHAARDISVREHAAELARAMALFRCIKNEVGQSDGTRSMAALFTSDKFANHRAAIGAWHTWAARGARVMRKTGLTPKIP